MKADFYKVKTEHNGNAYPWPCKPHPDRTIELFDDDILTKQPDGGGYTKHNGICCVNIPVPDDHLDAYEGWPAMSIGGRMYFEPKPIRKITALDKQESQ